MNLVILQGNLTRDVEYKNIGTTNVCNFGLAINRKTKNGQETVFVDVSAFGKTAEIISKYFQKGKMILIQGRLHLDKWQDTKSNQQRTKLKVVAERFFFCGGNQGSGQQAPQGAPQQNYQQPQGPQQAPSQPNSPFV